MKTTSILISLLLFSFISAHAFPVSTVEGSSTKIVCLKKVPIIEISLNGNVTYFVLDSGSDVSLLHLPEADSFGFTYQKRASKSIIGASGGNQPLFEASQVELKIDQQSLRTMYYATDLSSVVESLSISTGYTISGILGMDLMRRYGFEIDYGQQTLLLQHEV